MYEQYFGITGPPFQLTPDPAFFFASEQHSAALAALRSAGARQRPFVVLSGEIGAGKTTVLRTWLAEAEAAGTVVGQIANSQLDADDLLRLVAHAFGVAGVEQLPAFFGSLGERAALLIIDEAQNLGHEALRQSMAVAEMAGREHARLRICLAGQPGLRDLLGDPALQDLAAQVQQSCHLGALDRAETEAYVEHRLRRVGWEGRPAFDAGAFEAIRRESGGVPRRINALCHRLMLAQFLEGRARIDARTVLATASELDAELGTGLEVSIPLPAARDAATAGSRTAAAPGALDPARPTDHGSVLLVAGGRSDHVKAMPLLRALARADLPPARLVSLVARGAQWAGCQVGAAHDADGGDTIAPRHLVLADAGGTLEARFAKLIGEGAPRAVLVFDGDELSQRCAAVAHELGVALVHVGTDRQEADASAPESARSTIARLSGLRFASQSRPSQGDPGSIEVGNLLVDAIQWAEQQSARAPVPPGLRHALDDPRGYALAWLKEPSGRTQPWRDGRVELLREVALELPVVLPMAAPTLQLSSNADAGRGAGIVGIDELDHAGFVALMTDATCVLTDSLDVIEEAAVLGVPCLSLGPRHASESSSGGWLPAVPVGLDATRAMRAVWDAKYNLAPAVTSPTTWDGHAATRIVACLATWLEEARVPVG